MDSKKKYSLKKKNRKNRKNSITKTRKNTKKKIVKGGNLGLSALAILILAAIASNEFTYSKKTFDEYVLHHNLFSSGKNIISKEDNPFRDNPFRDNPFRDNPFRDNPFGDNPFGDNPFRDNKYRDNKDRNNLYEYRHNLRGYPHDWNNYERYNDNYERYNYERIFLGQEENYSNAMEDLNLTGDKVTSHYNWRKYFFPDNLSINKKYLIQYNSRSNIDNWISVFEKMKAKCVTLTRVQFEKFIIGDNNYEGEKFLQIIKKTFWDIWNNNKDWRNVNNKFTKAYDDLHNDIKKMMV